MRKNRILKAFKNWHGFRLRTFRSAHSQKLATLDLRPCPYITPEVTQDVSRKRTSADPGK